MPEETLIPSAAFTAAVTGRKEEDGNPLRPEFLHRIAPELDARNLWELSQAAQVQELFLIKTQADMIEEEHNRLGIPLPTVFVYYTAGFDGPEDAVYLGTYGDKKGPLPYFQPADIGGHAGQAKSLPIDEKQSALLFFGRAHPYSGIGQAFAELNYARPFNVIKELARRQRERGQECAIVCTYLTGVDEESPLRPGDLGIVIDHTEAAGGRAGLSAGAGPRNLLDPLIGERFQPKLGRASDGSLAKLFFELASERDIRVGPAAALGTVGTTSYQGELDRGFALAAFSHVAHHLDAQAKEMFESPLVTSLFYDMGLSFEADVIRQTIARHHVNGDDHYFEPDFPLLLIALPTDIVGSGSADVDHAAVVAEAFRHGARNGELIYEFVHRVANQLRQVEIAPPPEWVRPDFSLASLLPDN